jgi:hypothetical protein
MEWIERQKHVIDRIPVNKGRSRLTKFFVHDVRRTFAGQSGLNARQYSKYASHFFFRR